MPVTSLRAGFIDNTGLARAAAFDIRIGVVGRLAVGVNGTWNWFDQTFPSLTARAAAELHLHRPGLPAPLAPFTALGTAHYYLTQAAVQPYVGVGVGRRLDLDRWQQVVNRPQDREHERPGRGPRGRASSSPWPRGSGST